MAIPFVNWTEMPNLVRKGIRKKDPQVVSALREWIENQIETRSSYNDDSDVAQDLCFELLNLMATADGRRLLPSTENLDLESLLERLSRCIRRKQRRAEAKTAGDAQLTTLPVLNADVVLEATLRELDGAVACEIARMDSRSRRALDLRQRGLSRRRIGRRLWPKLPISVAEKRASEILKGTFKRLRQVAIRFGITIKLLPHRKNLSSKSRHDKHLENPRKKVSRKPHFEGL